MHHSSASASTSSGRRLEGGLGVRTSGCFGKNGEATPASPPLQHFFKVHITAFEDKLCVPFQRAINIALVQPDVETSRESHQSAATSSDTQHSLGGKTQLVVGGSARRPQARQQTMMLHLAQSEVLKLVSEKRDHMPPLTSAKVTYPFVITVEG